MGCPHELQAWDPLHLDLGDDASETSWGLDFSGVRCFGLDFSGVRCFGLDFSGVRRFGLDFLGDFLAGLLGLAVCLGIMAKARGSRSGFGGGPS